MIYLRGLQIPSESFIKWLGKNEHLSVEIFKQIIANYDRISGQKNKFSLDVAQPACLRC